MAQRRDQSDGSDFPKGVSQPARRALASVGVTRLDDTTQFSEAELLALHGMGPKALTAIKEALSERGKSLRAAGRSG